VVWFQLRVARPTPVNGATTSHNGAVGNGVAP
jgi:hypothetical protein